MTMLWEEASEGLFLLLSFIYVIPLCFVILTIYLNYRPDQKSLSIILFGFFLFCLMAILEYEYNLAPFAPDVLFYEKILESGKIVGAEYGKSVRFYSFISFFPGLLALRHPLLFSILNVAIYFFALHLYIRAFEIYIGKKIREKVLFLFFGFIILYPYSYWVIPTPHREAYAIFAFAFFLYSLMFFLKWPRKGILFLIISNFFILVRYQLILITLPFSILAMYIILWRKAKLDFPLRALIMFLITLPSLLCFIKLAQFFTGFKLNLNFLGSLRQFNYELYSASGFAYGGDLQWDTPFNVLRNSFLLFLQYLFAPLPILHNNNVFQTFLLFLDLIFVLLILMIILKNFYNLRHYLFWFFLSFISLFISSLYEFYYTATARHRIPFFLMLVLLASQLWSDRKAEVKCAYRQ